MPSKRTEKILHIFNDPKFSKDYFELLIKYKISLNKHFLFHYRCRKFTCYDFGMERIFSPSFFSILPNMRLLGYLFKADKIIIHSLASPFLLFYLFTFPFLIKKCYWAIWGKDLYFYKILKKPNLLQKIYEFFRKRVIRNIKYIINSSNNDIKLAKDWYQVDAHIFPCIGYPSNCFKDTTITPKQSNTTVILVGNSADPSNEHLHAFSILENFKHQNIKLILPLAYGNSTYAKKIKSKGLDIFGENLFVIDNFIPLQEYLHLLASIDIGLFSHSRQQAMGTIISLLGMRKKVYIRKDITTWDTLTKIGVNLYDINEFNLTAPCERSVEINRKIIKENFSERTLVDQWQYIFDY